ncbi:MAG TPA: hypothetical protein VHZ31_02700 [Solirubrobacteraceae bacterium]|nr:hypothetical protein [Solirubrobacteraceae bacterium]
MVGERVRDLVGPKPRPAGVLRVFSDEGDRVLVAFDGERELRWCRLDEVELEP